MASERIGTPQHTTRLTARQVRDVGAVGCLLVGGPGLLAVCFLASPLLGLGVVFTALIVAGVLLGMDR